MGRTDGSHKYRVPFPKWVEEISLSLPISKMKNIVLFLCLTVCLGIFWCFYNGKNVFQKEQLNYFGKTYFSCPVAAVNVSAPRQPRLVNIPLFPVSSRSQATVTILLWTKFFGTQFIDDYYFFLPGNETFSRYSCQYQCSVTADRKLLTSVDAILFHVPNFRSNVKLPKDRGLHQRWILYGIEAPRLIKMPWNKIDGLFNWTMTYREDSDIPVRYGHICEKMVSGETLDNDFLEKKVKDVVWIVSKCHTPSKREKYVQKLKSFISVDIYGKCGDKVCLPTQAAKCYEKILKKYKFYLAFENSICKDYVTEKFFNVLNFDIVPVTLGGANYSSFAPPGSFINAMDYPDPRKLAEHLKLVGSSSVLYNKYFQWKRKYKVYLQRWMCDLCEKLHVDNSVSVKYNLYKWFIKEAQCKKWNSDNKFV
ncbi:alpha-(1,3)-fucosyltransferase C-like isoform X1 [Tachypleus tridentatus]|uniref:alpha-(1,3)-fucosyltransferase C-like isoform X1 n=1 Tax=Tachypleus tridentatus TaxID=6853 RepID=UPI003FD34E25